MLPFEKKYKIYRWYSSLFEDLDPAERHLQNLCKMLELTKGRISTSHSVFRHLISYIGIRDSAILDIIVKILGSSAKNDIYFHSFRIIKDLMQRIEIEDLRKLKQIIEYSTKRGDFSIREEFESRF